MAKSQVDQEGSTGKAWRGHPRGNGRAGPDGRLLVPACRVLPACGGDLNRPRSRGPLQLPPSTECHPVRAAPDARTSNPVQERKLGTWPRRSPARAPPGGRGHRDAPGQRRPSHLLHYTGSGNGVLPGRRHLLEFAKTPHRPVQWPNFEEEDWPRHRPQQPVQLSVVLSFLLQDLRIVVRLERLCCRRGIRCRGVHRLRVVIGAPRHTSQRNQQAHGKREPVQSILYSHSSMVGKAATQNNRVPSLCSGRTKTGAGSS